MAPTIDRKAEAITVREYAARKRVSLGTVYRRIWAGQISAQQFLGRWLIRDVGPDTHATDNSEQKTTKKG